MFNTALNEYVEQLEFTAFIYTIRSENGVIYIAVYVDDLLIIGLNENEIDHIKTQLSEKVDIKDKGARCIICAWNEN